MNKVHILFLTLLATGVFSANNVHSQQDSTTTNVYEQLSLEDLLNVKIVSVSKQSELLFDAPLSASVITKDDIRRAGSTSIMEALRLVPGMIVREQTNGNYDIYMRGMDNVPPNGAFEGNSTTTLVMINNRPIYNYLKGGTFWETLPIDLNDVEKIEVVRGPAAALYGPNAVSGVINILTREITRAPLHVVANSHSGSNNTFVNNISLSHRFNKKWGIMASGNYQSRGRSQTSYYEFFRNEWLTEPDYFIGLLNDTITNVDQIYPRPNQAMKKYAGNVFLNYRPSSGVEFDLMTGAQHSMVQKVSTENGFGPLTTVASDSRYADLRAKIREFSAQFAFNEGTQVVDHQGGSKYDFSTLDANVEYNFTRNALSIKPGLGYRSAVYDDTKYSDTLIKNGIFNNRGEITMASASLRGEYKLFNDRVRLVAGLMANKFNYPDTMYISHELAATYKIAKKHLVRAVYSQAPRSSNIYDNYVDYHIDAFPIGYRKNLRVNLESNKNLKLLTAQMFELGYRANFSKSVSLDIELFNIASKNYSAITTNDSYVTLEGEDTTYVMPYRTTNLPLTLLQQGVTFSLTYSSGKIQARPFMTLQYSKIKDYSSFLNTPGADPSQFNSDPANNNIYSGIGTSISAKSTPRVFGGISLNYTPADKWNFNINAYYYSEQTYYHASNAAFRDGVRGIDHIKAKCIVNANLSYQAVKGINFFCTAKNMLDNESREFFRTDAVPFMFLGGVHIDMKK